MMEQMVFCHLCKGTSFSVSFLQAGNHCWLCGKNCNSEKQWQQHITSEKHKERVFNSEDDQNCWQYRFPTGTFKVCERWVDERFGWWSSWGFVPLSRENVFAAKSIITLLLLTGRSGRTEKQRFYWFVWKYPQTFLRRDVTMHSCAL